MAGQVRLGEGCEGTVGQDTGPWGLGPGGADEQGLASQCPAPSMGLGAPAGGRDGRSDGRAGLLGSPHAQVPDLEPTLLGWDTTLS